MIHNVINMKIILLIGKALIMYLFIILKANGVSTGFFEEGKLLFEKKQFEKSKILFERDIVFNPKSEKSYLYLAKIFNSKEEDKEEEANLNNVILLNPQNEEAIYMLTLLKIKQSDYSNAKKLIEKFDLVCDSFCPKKSELKSKFSKLIPVNE